MIPCLYTIVNDARYGFALLKGQKEVSRNSLEPAFQRNDNNTIIPQLI